MDVISLRQFAKLVGVSQPAVSKAVKSGRLEESVIRDDDGKLVGIDPEKGFEEWQMHTVNGNRPLPGPPEKIIEGVMSFSEARTVREYYRAKLAEIEYRVQKGELLDSAKVEEHAFKRGRAIRDAILLIPDRYAHILSAETDPERHNKILTDAFLEALDTVPQDVNFDELRTKPAPKAQGSQDPATSVPRTKSTKTTQKT